MILPCDGKEARTECKDYRGRISFKNSLNLIDAGNIGDVNRFQSDLQLIFGMLEYRVKKNGMKEYADAHRDYFENVDIETYQAMRELTHSGNQLKAVTSSRNGKEMVNMCTALEALFNDGVQQGIESGIRAMVKICKEFNLSQEEILDRIVKEFSLSPENALKYLE